MKRRPPTRFEQPYRPAWLWVMRACLVVLIVLSPAVTSRAAGYPGEATQTLPTEHTALVMAPLASPDQLSSAAQRMQQAGFVIYEHLGGQNGEYLLAGIKRAGDEALPDVGSPLRVLDPNIAQGSYYLVLAPRGRPQPVWNKYGALLLDDGAQVLLRTTAEQAERLALQGAELQRMTFRPIVFAGQDQGGARAPFDFNPFIQAAINQVTSQKVYDYTARLSGMVPVTVGGSPYTIATRNTTSGVPIQRATQYVGEFMTGLGYTVTNHPWTLSGYSGVNVVGERLGLTRPNDIYIIGAHLDDMPNTLTAPGADDNASGSVATMLAAEILSQYTWDVTLRFVFWTGEEQGLLGSDVYAALVHSQHQNILGYLNLDMLAWNSSAPRTINLFWKSTVPASQSIADLFISTVSTYGLNLAPIKYNANLGAYTIGNYSDNKSFWDEGYPSILAIEDYIGNDFNTGYHTVNDTLANTDLDYYTTFVKATLATFAHMAGGPLTGPAAVSLASFDAAPASGGVQISWHTVSEIDNTGFNVYRSLTAAQPDQLLAFVPSQAPGSTQGAAYSFLDSDVVEGQTLWYWLEDVGIDGSTSLHGPVGVQYLAPTAVTVAEMAAGAAPPGSWSYPVLAAGLALGIVLWSIRRKSQRQRTLL